MADALRCTIAKVPSRCPSKLGGASAGIIDQPARPAQQLGNLAIAVAAILPGQLDDIVCQPC